jgi:hypothetical protein
VNQPLPALERPAFFAGQRLTADDLAAAQAYSRELRWLHNRSLHGWGIVVGLAVSGARGEREVEVSPGFAHDCAGRELVLEGARRLRVPPVAEGSFELTISFADDAALERVTRHGACGTEGATRIIDDAALRWISTDALRVGHEVVLGRVTVVDCAIDALSLDGRDKLGRGGPHIAAGQTAPGATPWRLWPTEFDPFGLATTVSTAEGGFATTPAYQARLAGSRDYRGDTIIDGHPVVSSAGPDSFEFAMLLPKGDSLVASGFVPFNDLDFEALRKVARDELQWHVVWMGVEA